MLQRVLRSAEEVRALTRSGFHHALGAVQRPSRVSRPALALRAFVAGDWRTAAALLEQAVRAHPDRLAMWVQLGHAHKEQGDLAAAESSYRRVLELDQFVAD